MKNKKGITLIIVLCMAIGLFSCQGIKIIKPGAPELAGMAEGVAETIIVFLPLEYHQSLIPWRVELEAVRDKLESGEPITGDWIKEKVVDVAGKYLIRLVDTSETLTEAQKTALVNDFNRSLGMIKVEGQLELTPDQATVIYGAVNGFLSGIDLIGI